MKIFALYDTIPTYTQIWNFSQIWWQKSDNIIRLFKISYSSFQYKSEVRTQGGRLVTDYKERYKKQYEASSKINFHGTACATIPQILKLFDSFTTEEISLHYKKRGELELSMAYPM